jgi:hypothetical protein
VMSTVGKLKKPGKLRSRSFGCLQSYCALPHAALVAVASVELCCISGALLRRLLAALEGLDMPIVIANIRARQL